MLRPEVERKLTDAYGDRGYGQLEEHTDESDLSVEYFFSERIGSWRPARLEAFFFEGRLYRVILGGYCSRPGFPIHAPGDYGTLKDALAAKYPNQILGQDKSYFYDFPRKTTIVLKPSYSSLELMYDVTVDYLDQVALVALDGRRDAAKATERERAKTKL